MSWFKDIFGIEDCATPRRQLIVRCRLGILADAWHALHESLERDRRQNYLLSRASRKALAANCEEREALFFIALDRAIGAGLPADSPEERTIQHYLQYRLNNINPGRLGKMYESCTRIGRFPTRLLADAIRRNAD